MHVKKLSDAEARITRKKSLELTSVSTSQSGEKKNLIIHRASDESIGKSAFSVVGPSKAWSKGYSGLKFKSLKASKGSNCLK